MAIESFQMSGSLKIHSPITTTTKNTNINHTEDRQLTIHDIHNTSNSYSTLIHHSERQIMIQENKTFIINKDTVQLRLFQSETNKRKRKKYF